MVKLSEITFSSNVIYYCNKHASQCIIVGSYHDDGAALFIELIKDGYLTSKYRLTESCHLSISSDTGDK